MTIARDIQKILLLALAFTALALMATQASAHKRSVKAKKSPSHAVKIADRDHDLASNRCEQQAGTNRWRKDSDHDGRNDGLEDSDRDGANNAAESITRSSCGTKTTRMKIDDAKIVSLSDAGELTVRVGRRGVITAPLSSKLVCVQEVDDELEDDDDSDEVEESDDDVTHDCGVADLKRGVEIDDAVIRGGSFVWIELEEEDDD